MTERILKNASLAQIGGFRPLGTHLTSWFGGLGVGLADEVIPTYHGMEMPPLLQIRVDELPVVPTELLHTAMLVVFMSRNSLPTRTHGEGWCIREYSSLDGIKPLPKMQEIDYVKPFPITWHTIHNDAPSWEDLSEVYKGSPESMDVFNDEYSAHQGTKIGGYPLSLQHGVGLKDYVFQIDSEPKANWNLVDAGLAYFHKRPSGWEISIQFL